MCRSGKKIQETRDLVITILIQNNIFDQDFISKYLINI